MRLGIDFGTTHTVVAMADRGNYPVVTFADARGDHHDFFPTVAAERGGQLFFGWDALALEHEPGVTILRSFKRRLGQSDAAPGAKVRIGHTETTIGTLIAGFLAALRAAIPGAGTDAIPAAVAVPANAHGTQRFVTLDAFRRAGFEVVALVNEPSAAAFEYTHRHRAALNSKRDRIVVYDLGGGTFDASTVRMAGRRHEVLATAGVSQLGGDDFDLVLREVVLEKAGVAASTLDAVGLARLTDACRVAKEALSPNSRRIAIDLAYALGAGAWPDELTVAVDAFYEAATPLVARSIEAMRPIVNRLGDDEAQDELRGDIAGIYVVGGASALPLVGRVLREEFGRRVIRSPYPFAAVAIGLAIAADRESGYELQDRFSRHFGVFREARAGREIVFDAIFDRDVALPLAGDTLTLSRRYRATHNVGHFRFAEVAGVDAHGVPSGDLTPFGEIRFAFDRGLRGADLGAVEITRLGHGPIVEEQYVIDPNGLVEVKIRDLDSGYAESHHLGA